LNNSHRQCKSCLETFDIKNFFVSKVVDNKERRRHVCRSCYSQKIIQRRSLIRESYIEWKKSLSCQACGFADYRALHFHHHDQNKEGNVADMVQNGSSLERIKKEASKCTVLCANCHAIAHNLPGNFMQHLKK